MLLVLAIISLILVFVFFIFGDVFDNEGLIVRLLCIFGNIRYLCSVRNV